MQDPSNMLVYMRNNPQNMEAKEAEVIEFKPKEKKTPTRFNPKVEELAPGGATMYTYPLLDILEMCRPSDS